MDIVLQNVTTIGKEGSKSVLHFKPSRPYEEFNLASSLGQLFPQRDAAKEAAAPGRPGLMR